MKPQLNSFYSTVEVMKSASVGRNTLRLYESRGLLGPLVRSESGYRRYTGQHLSELAFIKNAKEMGLTLQEIAELLKVIRAQTQVNCGSVRKKISAKLSEIDFQISKLELKKKFLKEFLNTCNSKDQSTKCDVLGKGFSKKACCD